MERIDASVEEIVAELHRDHPREVPSSVIGKKVLEKLLTIDEVAYVRFASVYRQYRNADEFIEILRQAEKRKAIDPLQGKLSLG